MGDPLIKEATKQLMAASGSYVHVFSTLSPIPGFREWLIQYLVEGTFEIIYGGCGWRLRLGILAQECVGIFILFGAPCPLPYKLGLTLAREFVRIT